MSGNPQLLVRPIWNYSNILPNDGLSFRRQSILLKAFTGKLLTADDADHTDKK